MYLAEVLVFCLVFTTMSHDKAQLHVKPCSSEVTSLRLASELILQICRQQACYILCPANRPLLGKRWPGL